MRSDSASSTAGAGPRRAILLELGIVASLAAAFLAAFQARPGYINVLLAVAAVGFILAGYGRSQRLWRRLASDPRPYRLRLKRAALGSGAFTAAALAALLTTALISSAGSGGAGEAVARIGNPHLVGAALLYLPWALLQQFVFQFYLLGRLLTVLPVNMAIAITALAFSAVHFPRAPVMVVTLLAGGVWAWLYRRHRTILPLAASHALLGSALHYWVFGRDLLADWLAGS